MAAGRGDRFGRPKQFTPLHGRPMIVWAIERFEREAAIDSIVLVVSPGSEERVTDVVEQEGFAKIHAIVAGGETRQESVWQGLQALDEASERVLVHDAARACLSQPLLERMIAALAQNDAVVPALPVVDTLIHQSDGELNAMLDRENIAGVQTPQAFRTALLIKAHRSAAASGLKSSDDGSLVFALGEPVRTIEGERTNIKITFEEDLRIAEAIIDLQRQC
jgi:2-C-methyl-D-erythritol 4-phosphate cytidylyltransferase